MFPSVRLVALAVETVLASDLQQWRRRCDHSCAFRLRFSLTEAEDLAVACIDPNEDVAEGFVPALYPVTDKRLSIVDEQGRKVAVGEVGDLVVHSSFMSEGYWLRPETDDDNFGADPDHPDQQVYRTGDPGRFLKGGGFEYLGRRDG